MQQVLQAKMLTVPAATFQNLFVVSLIAANAPVPTIVVRITMGMPRRRCSPRVCSAEIWCPNCALVTRKCQSSSNARVASPQWASFAVSSPRRCHPGLDPSVRDHVPSSMKELGSSRHESSCSVQAWAAFTSERREASHLFDRGGHGGRAAGRLNQVDGRRRRP